MTGTYGQEEKHSRRVLRGQLFSKGKFNNSLFCSVYLVFSIRLIPIADLFAVRYLWNAYVTRIYKCCVVTHRTSDILVASLSLFTWLV